MIFGSRLMVILSSFMFKVNKLSYNSDAVREGVCQAQEGLEKHIIFLIIFLYLMDFDGFREVVSIIFKNKK